MKLLSAVAGGFAGACAVTLIHQVLKRYDPEAPRMDLMAMDAITKSFIKLGKSAPKKEAVYNYSLAGDLVANTLFFSLAPNRSIKKAITRSALLGVSAGLGAIYAPIYAPKPLGLKEKHSNKTTKTQLMSLGYYLLGGLVASVVGRMIEKKTLSKILLLNSKNKGAPKNLFKKQ